MAPPGRQAGGGGGTDQSSPQKPLCLLPAPPTQIPLASQNPQSVHSANIVGPQEMGSMAGEPLLCRMEALGSWEP